MTFTIKTRLLALTSLTLVMMLVLGATSYHSLSSAGNGMSQLLGSGDILRRHVAMVFDAYLTRAAAAPACSRAS